MKNLAKNVMNIKNTTKKEEEYNKRETRDKMISKFIKEGKGRVFSEVKFEESGKEILYKKYF